MIESKKLPNGFEYVEVNNDSANCKIALQGAHVFHYERVNEEPILWLSESSDFKLGSSIRGGIPVCWPWFGINSDKTLPQHGFARVSKWKLSEAVEIDDTLTELKFTLKDTESSFALWPYRFELELHVKVSDKLEVKLKTINCDVNDFEISQALHTYFSVSHISKISVAGLDKKPYIDALSWSRETQVGNVTFNKEVDRVYQDVDDEILLIDETRELHVSNSGSFSVVVWNPWIEKCGRMSAMNSDAYKYMVCIETANAFDDSRVIKAGESHTLGVTIY